MKALYLVPPGILNHDLRPIETYMPSTIPPPNSDFTSLDPALEEQILRMERPLFELCLAVTEALREQAPLHISQSLNRRLNIVGSIEDAEGKLPVIADLVALDCALGGRWDLVDSLRQQGLKFGSHVDDEAIKRFLGKMPRGYMDSSLFKIWQKDFFTGLTTPRILVTRYTEKLKEEWSAGSKNPATLFQLGELFKRMNIAIGRNQLISEVDMGRLLIEIFKHPDEVAKKECLDSFLIGGGKIVIASHAHRISNYFAHNITYELQKKNKNDKTLDATSQALKWLCRQNSWHALIANSSWDAWMWGISGGPLNLSEYFKDFDVNLTDEHDKSLCLLLFKLAIHPELNIKPDSSKENIPFNTLKTIFECYPIDIERQIDLRMRGQSEPNKGIYSDLGVDQNIDLSEAEKVLKFLKSKGLSFQKIAHNMTETAKERPSDLEAFILTTAKQEREAKKLAIEALDVMETRNRSLEIIPETDASRRPSVRRH